MLNKTRLVKDKSSNRKGYGSFKVYFSPHISSRLPTPKYQKVTHVAYPFLLMLNVANKETANAKQLSRVLVYN